MKLAKKNKHHIKDYMQALLLFLLCILSGFILFWIAPMLANQASNFLLVLAVVLFLIALFIMIFSLRWFYRYITSSLDFNAREEEKREGKEGD